VKRAATAAFAAAVLLYLAGVGIDTLRPDGIVPFHAQWGIGAVVSAFGLLFFAGTLVMTLVISMVSSARHVEAAQREEAANWRTTAKNSDDAHRRFMARFDHQLKNPVQAILGMADEIEFVSGKSEYVETIKHQVERLKSLGDDLVQLGNLKPELPVEDVDLKALVYDFVAEVHQWKHGRGRTVRVERGSVALPNVRAEPKLLRQALSNVLDNALKYSAPETEVCMRLYQDESHVFLDVVDYGDGIPLEDHQLVFDELFRGHHQRVVEGKGLGLPLARAIVRGFGGDLTCVSDSTGTEMRFTLRRSGQ
jgi:two-component system OmpR family sensor kinase